MNIINYMYDFLFKKSQIILISVAGLSLYSSCSVSDDTKIREIENRYQDSLAFVRNELNEAKKKIILLSYTADQRLRKAKDFFKSDELDKAKSDIIPKDGTIFAGRDVVFYEGESVFNVLVREMKRNKIHIEYEMSPIYETAYIKGIANIYEFDCGDLSGWLYKVNGQVPNVGCSLYYLNDGDVVELVYTCEMGKDLE